VARIAQFHRNREIKAGGARTDTGDLHSEIPLKFTKFTERSAFAVNLKPSLGVDGRTLETRN